MPGPVVGRAEVDVHADLSPFRRELRAAAARAGRDYGDTLASSIDSRLRRTTRIFDRFWGSTLRGSRNDFLNFVGVVSAGIERLVGNVLGRGLGLVASGFENLGNVIARFPSLLQFAGGFRLIGDNIRGLGAGGIDGLIIQLGALVLAFNIGVGVIGVFAAGISTLTAGVTALAVGIGGALFGGIVALVPVVGALIAGIGTLTLGFSSLSDAQKAAFEPLSDLLDELRSGVQEELFSGLGDQVDGLVAALTPLGPFLNSVAAEVSDWVSQIIGEIGPGGPLAATFASLGDSVPETFGRLLDVISNVSGSLLGLFDAATPAADRLLDAINKVLGEFNLWVNSVEGQEAINEFLQTALDLLGSLYEIASEVGTALSNLWEQGGADAAQVLLDNIRDIVEEFNNWLATEEGREALLQWFEDGVTALQNLGTFLGTIIGLFDSLDTALTREGFSQFLTFLSTAVLWLTGLVDLANENITAFLEFGDALLTNIGGALSQIGPLAEAAFQVLVGAFETAQIVATAFWLGLQDGASRASAAVGTAMQAVSDAVDAVATFIIGQVTATVAAWTQFATGVRTAITNAIQAITNLRTRASDAFNRLQTAIGRALGGAARSVQDFVSRAVGAFGTLVGRVRGAADNVVGALGRLAGRASAALGRFVSAIQRGISQALRALGRFTGDAARALADLPGRFTTIGFNIMQGLYNGVVAAGGRVLDYIRNLASTAASTFASILRIGSPSKVFEEFGKNIVEGLVEGLDAGIGDVLAATNALGDAAAFPAMNTPVSGLATQAASTDAGGVPVRSTTEVGGITIVTPYANPRLVALEVMDELAARGK